MKRNRSRNPLAAALAAALIVAAGAAHAADSGETQKPGETQKSGDAPNREFMKLDVNRDGYVSSAEARALAAFDRAFTEADGNRDGRLDPSEFATAQAIHARQRAGQFVEDSVITAKVKTALLKDPVVKGTAVNVETYHGTVLLSGFVASQQQMQRAAELAAGISGVVTVRNGLAVKG